MRRTEVGSSVSQTGITGDWLDQIPAAAAVLTPEGNVAGWNSEAAQLLGLGDEAMPGARFAAGTRWFERLSSEAGRDGSSRALITRRRGHQRSTIEVRARSLDDGSLLVLLRDVTGPIQTEECLRTSHERLRLITDVVRDHAILTIDVDGAIVSWNATAEQLTGYAADQVINQPFSSVTADANGSVPHMFRQAWERGRHEDEIDILRRDGTEFRAQITIAPQCRSTGKLTGYTIVMRDLTERLRAEEDLRRSEEQLRHSQKMDAVGRLAAGIAHDFNNVLTAIQGHVQFLLEDLPSEDASYDDALEIQKAADRATQLTRQLLTFARRQPSEPASVDLNEVIEGVEKLLRRLIRADIQLEKELQKVAPVFADPGQLEQVIVNLVVNARDAMQQGGVITIRTSTIRLDQAYPARDLDLAAGEYVQMTVTDTGHGIPEDVRAQIFEPFFTTKAEGTGLGLPTVYGITKQSGGHVSVYSEHGIGTTFKVFLPVHIAAVVESDQASVDLIEDDSGIGSVLLVDDDDAIRALARRTLEGSGFAVIEASNGEDALSAARQAGNVIDVVVTDMMMPRMNGEELAVRVTAMHPRIGIVMMSGFSETTLSRRGRMDSRPHFLEKPFTPVSLVRAVRRAMHRPS